MNRFESAKKENGSVTFGGVEYALTEDAYPTSRCLPGGYTNYNDAADGEAYDFEMAARAVGPDGDEYKVYWIFEGRKGEDGPELDSYDYTEVDRAALIG